MAQLITVKGIAEGPGKLAELVQHEGLKLQARSRPDHGSHILQRIFPVKNQPLKTEPSEKCQHFPVDLPGFPA